MDARKYNRFIIRKGGRYLYNVEGIVKPVPTWKDSAWDAWFTKRKDIAKRVARRIDGHVVEFNPATGRVSV